MEENKEWSDESFKKFTVAKFTLLREIIKQQIRVNGKFQIETGYENPCRRCNGIGEIYNFQRSNQTLPCMKCANNQLKEGEKCRTCLGTKKVKVFAIQPEIRSVTICGACHGRGYFEPENYDNPVLSRVTAEEFKKKINFVEKQEVRSVSDIVNAPQISETKPEQMIDPQPPAD
jgi:cytochrome c553